MKRHERKSAERWSTWGVGFFKGYTEECLKSGRFLIMPPLLLAMWYHKRGKGALDG